MSSPASEAHAKVMGTTTTLCGRSTLSWYKFWDLAFVKVPGARCPDCSSAMADWLAGRKAR